jgi:hypothetical protein
MLLKSYGQKSRNFRDLFFLKVIIDQNFFWVHFVTKASLQFWKEHQIPDLLIPISTHSEREKNFGPY